MQKLGTETSRVRAGGGMSGVEGEHHGWATSGRQIPPELI